MLSLQTSNKNRRLNHYILFNFRLCQLPLAWWCVALWPSPNMDSTFSQRSIKIFLLPFGWVFIYLAIIQFFCTCVHPRHNLVILHVGSVTDIGWGVEIHMVAWTLPLRSTYQCTCFLQCSGVTLNTTSILASSKVWQILDLYWLNFSITKKKKKMTEIIKPAWLVR